jgi:hypothetical protein
MVEGIFVTAEAIEDDVLIRFPDEFGIENGAEFEINRRSDGVIILTSPKLNNGKK